jgi:hypothetical protein
VKFSSIKVFQDIVLYQYCWFWNETSYIVNNNELQIKSWSIFHLLLINIWQSPSSWPRDLVNIMPIILSLLYLVYALVMELLIWYNWNCPYMRDGLSVPKTFIESCRSTASVQGQYCYANFLDLPLEIIHVVLSIPKTLLAMLTWSLIHKKIFLVITVCIKIMLYFTMFLFILSLQKPKHNFESVLPEEFLPLI